MRLKGLALVETKDPVRVAAGRELLARLLSEHPDNVLEAAGAHRILAESYLLERRLDRAESHLRAGLNIETGRHVDHETELRLAEVLIAQGNQDAFDDAWELLNRSADKRFLFNDSAWRIRVARARLLDLKGTQAEAARYAQSALELLEHGDPQLPRHPDVGLIEPDPSTIDEMEMLARSGPSYRRGAGPSDASSPPRILRKRRRPEQLLP